MKRWCLVLAIAACGDNKLAPDGAPPTDSRPDSPVFDAPPDANPLARVQGTGLCDDDGCATINAGITEYVPNFPLYADGASKRRWIQLPAGTKIDTTNMDRWVFPVGTKFWKEFTSGPTRVETRFITKLLDDDEAPNAWFFVTYIWNAAQDDTVATTSGQMDANGTTFNVPSRANCKECHDSLKPSRVLGFQAIQLDGATPFGLEDLITADLLTAPPTTGTAGNRFPLPGLTVDKKALGYFHGNCGHCHNPQSPTHDIVPLELGLVTTSLASVATTPTFTTTVGQNAMPFMDNGITYTKIIVAHDPDHSALLARLNLITTSRRMPKLGTETVDPIGEPDVLAWINSL